MKSVRRLLLLALSAVTASCGKDGGKEVGEDRVRMVFFAAGPATKADEAAVESLDLLVFRADNGRLDAYGRASGGTRVGASLSAGTTVHYHLVANAPEGTLERFTDEPAFLAADCLLSQGHPLSMHGSGSVQVREGAGDIPVPLDRYACKVSMQGVEVRWPEAFCGTTGVKVGRVVLVNAVGSIPYSGTPAAGPLWYNRMGIEPEEAPVADMTTASYDIQVPSSERIPLGKSLYAMPNPTDNAVDASNTPQWSVRNTRIALELVVDGVSNWYPVDLPAMQCNRHYVITTLAVLGPGSAGPDIPVSRNGLAFSVEVPSWDEAEQDISFEDDISQ